MRQQGRDNDKKINALIEDGPATSRNALLLLQTMAFPNSVIENAQALANQFDAEQVWDTV